MTYGLLTKCEVKMAGYWSSSFFASLWTETEAILTEQTWSIMAFGESFLGGHGEIASSCPLG